MYVTQYINIIKLFCDYLFSNVDTKHKSSMIANVQIKFPICIYCHNAIYLVLKYITSVVS